MGCEYAALTWAATQTIVRFSHQSLREPGRHRAPTSSYWPDQAVVAVDLARVRAVIDRIAADMDEFARPRRGQDLNTAAVLPDPRAERRWRLAEPDLDSSDAWGPRRRFAWLPASPRAQEALGAPVIRAEADGGDPHRRGGPCHRVLNPDGQHLLLRLTRAIGDPRRPTQLVHFITPYSPQPQISHEVEFCAGTAVLVAWRGTQQQPPANG